MKLIYAVDILLSALLALTGVLLLSGIKVTGLYQRLIRREKPQTLKERLEVMKGTPPKNFFKREFYNVERLLREMGKEGSFQRVKALAFLGAIAGGALALLFHNPFLAPVLVLLLGGAPFLYIRVQAQRYTKAINEALESTISLITTSYLRSDNLIASVEENLPYLHPAVVPYFKEFVVEATRVRANVVTAINSLQLKINHPIFQEWCRGLILCQQDSSMKKGLQPIVRKFSDNRTIQTDLDAEMYAPKRELLIMVVLTLAMPFFLYLMNKEWGVVLFTTVPGKITLAVVLAIVLYVFIKTWFFTKPVQFRGGEEE